MPPGIVNVPPRRDDLTVLLVAQLTMNGHRSIEVENQVIVSRGKLVLVGSFPVNGGV
jgi:hypothetical protein